MRSRIEAVVAELKLLRGEGVGQVAVDPATVDLLRRKVRERLHQPDPEKPVQVAAENAPAEKPSASVPKSVPVAKSFPKNPLPALPEGSKRERWQWLREQVLACPVCQQNLNAGGRVVFGTGNIDADIFFCGEAPGADEERIGEPFVGKAGELLDKMIVAMGLKRTDVYIGNIMNWRPQTGKLFGNRPPTEAEMAFCLPYLEAQLAVVQPKVVVALGATAVAGLLGIDSKGKMGKLRGHWQEKQGIPVMPTYHPSYLLQQGTNAKKREVWEDLLSVMERVGMPVSEKQRRYFLAR